MVVDIKFIVKSIKVLRESQLKTMEYLNLQDTNEFKNLKLLIPEISEEDTIKKQNELLEQINNTRDEIKNIVNKKLNKKWWKF